MKECSTTQAFVFKALKVHGELYDYSKVVYERAIRKVKIICKTHGVFLQQPSNHLSGYGCKKCAIALVTSGRVNTLNYFISKSNKLHNNKYDYSLAERGHNDILVKIICPRHGMFLQAPKHHLLGKGCRKCGTESSIKKGTSNTKEWIKKSKKIHGNKYDYSLSEYTKKENKLTIICKIHGSFNQSAKAHLRGCGCPICSKVIQNHAYRKSKHKDSKKIPCSIYIVNLSNSEENFYKIGVSSNVHCRFYSINAIYKNILVKLFNCNLLQAITLEQKVLKFLNPYRYKPLVKFDGQKECLNINPKKELLRQIKIYEYS